MLKRYLFINGLNNNYNLEDMVSILNISISSARKWLKSWNEDGLSGLKIEWGEGRPSYLSNTQKQQVREYIKNNHVTRHSQVREFILNNFKVEYSLKHIYRLLKKN
jgi:transposase